MGLVNQEAFVVTAGDLGQRGRRLRDHIVYGTGIGIDRTAALDRASALRVYDQIKAYVMRNGYLPGKYLRPWEIDQSIYANLDRNEPWWGFEFETGYVTQQARSEVVEHTWDTFTNVCFDSEGEGDWQVEITFAPEEKSKYDSGEAQAIKFIEYLTNNPRVYNGGQQGIGTHINMSHPKLTVKNYHRVTWELSRTLAALPMKRGDVEDVRKHMFGRSQLYGGFFAQAAGDAIWIEGKLFRTTYDVTTFKRYLKVVAGLTKCMEVLCDPKYSDVGCWYYVDNLYEVCFEGAYPLVRKTDYESPMDGTRNGNAINGRLARDVLAGVVASPIEIDDDLDDDDDYDEDDDEGPWCEECQEHHW